MAASLFLPGPNLNGDNVWTGSNTFTQNVAAPRFLGSSAGTAAAPTFAWTAALTRGLYDNGGGPSLSTGGAEQFGSFAGGVYVPTGGFVYFDGGSSTYMRFAASTLTTTAGGASTTLATAGFSTSNGASGTFANVTTTGGIVTSGT